MQRTDFSGNSLQPRKSDSQGHDFNLDLRQRLSSCDEVQRVSAWTPSYSPAYDASALHMAAVPGVGPPSAQPSPRVSSARGTPSSTPVPRLGGMPLAPPPTNTPATQALSARGPPSGSPTAPGPLSSRKASDSSPGTARSYTTPTRAERIPGANTSSTPISPAAKRNHNSMRNMNRAQNSSRIDPEQVPRPVHQPEALKEEGGKVYETNRYHVPPSATAVCTIVDKGSASCEFLRCTVNQVPAYPATANSAHIPVAAVCQPFAQLTSREAPVPVVDFGDEGPFRCPRCKSYVNPHFTWSNYGEEATCNFCGHRFDAPQVYSASTDDKGQPNERLELQFGTVDYVAPNDYYEKLPGTPALVFVIDASAGSLQSGLFAQVLCTLRSLLGFQQGGPFRLGIITFDHAIHFSAFSPGAESGRIITVSDIEDPLVPRNHEELCIDVEDPVNRQLMENLLDRIPGVFVNRQSDEAAGGAALKVATELVATQGGGHVIMFHSVLPNTGIGALRDRDDIKLYTTPEAVASCGGLFGPQQAPFFKGIGDACLSKGVAVSVFCCPLANAYIDVATLSVVPRRTGGEIIYLPNFDVRRDGEQLHHLIARIVVQGAAYSCVFKLRCSRGLQVDSMYAPWDAEVIDQSTFAVSRMSTDSTAVCLITHSERVEGLRHAYLQVACLYTDRLGNHFIRVQTLQLPVTTSLSNVFRYAEVDAVTLLLMKQAGSMALSGSQVFKDKLTKWCVDMLHAYRVNCASMTSSGQLILPDSLKMLPLFICSIRKMPAFRAAADVRVDERMANLIRLLALPIGLIAALVYPKVYTLWPLPERAGFPTGVGDNVHMPPNLPCTVSKLANDRIYLVDNGLALRVYIREETSDDTLWAALGATSVAQVSSALVAMFAPEAHLADGPARIAAIIQQIRRERNRLPWQPVIPVTKGTPEEARVLGLLIEDRVVGETPYVEYLCHVHKLVQNKLD
eukprot:TRINITY_DN43342_c0_g1_i1.p1 TRINITY_DN43342_c0_g1~~TRINITY_DN43342_c0_g1_i1.p1  ORF type:complete len:965 (+),score=178.67 TRINITY_DN43342_c0_g1_i1:82-2976(+)